MAVSKFQKFDTETIKRSDIKNADYNPRIMGKESKRMLRRSLSESGLVSALTWNKRTGNLVGGHQRLEQLDALEKSRDYELTVCVVDVDEREEAKLNVQLNNPSMQGDWDLDKLANITEDFDLSFDQLGFSNSEIELMFGGDDRFTELFDTPEAEGEKEKLREIKEARKTMNERLEQKNNADFYITVVFSDSSERDSFMRDIHVPVTEQYITGEQARRLADI